MNKIPHANTVIAFCVAGMFGYALLSAWSIFYGDPAQIGDVIGTWKTFAVAAFSFWVGASSGGKVTSDPEKPQKVKIEQPAGEPVPTTVEETPPGLNREIQP